MTYYANAIPYKYSFPNHILAHMTTHPAPGLRSWASCSCGPAPARWAPAPGCRTSSACTPGLRRMQNWIAEGFVNNVEQHKSAPYGKTWNARIILNSLVTSPCCCGFTAQLTILYPGLRPIVANESIYFSLLNNSLNWLISILFVPCSNVCTHCSATMSIQVRTHRAYYWCYIATLFNFSKQLESIFLAFAFAVYI